MPQYFERRLEHVLGVISLKSLLTGSISGEQGVVEPKLNVIFQTGGDGEDGMGEIFL